MNDTEVNNSKVNSFRSFIHSHVVKPKGQALITLLFFTIIGVTVTSAAVVMILVNSRSGQKHQQGEIAYQIAVSGAENGVLRLLRNPAYGGETLAIGSGSATVTVSGAGPYTLVSTGELGNFARRVEYTVTYQDNLLQVTNKRELYN